MCILIMVSIFHFQVNAAICCQYNIILGSCPVLVAWKILQVRLPKRQSRQHTFCFSLMWQMIGVQNIHLSSEKHVRFSFTDKFLPTMRCGSQILEKSITLILKVRYTNWLLVCIARLKNGIKKKNSLSVQYIITCAECLLISGHSNLSK